MKAKGARRGKRVATRPKYLLKVKIKGPGVRTKSIAVPDLVKICDSLQAAVQRQAEAMEGQPTLRPGPRTATAREECTLEFVAIGRGSTSLAFRLAKPQQPLPGSMTFGIEVVTEVATIVKEVGSRRARIRRTIDPGVLDSLSKLGDLLEKKAISEIVLSVPRHNATKRVKAVFNTTVKERITQRIKVPTEERMSVEGRLEMADFKELGKICRIHPPIGPSVQCTFSQESEDEVYAALRKPVRLTGIAKINPNTGRADELHIEQIEILDQLLVGAKEFFASRIFEQLAEAQGVRPLTNPNVLLGGWPDEEDLDQFLEETYQSRSV